MVTIKFLGLIATFYFFAVLGAFGQNFYPARYGKRYDNDSRGEKNFPEGRRFERRDNQEALTDRKIRFFLSGGRYGKRDCWAENCSQGSKEMISSGVQSKQDRNERIRIPIRKNQFMIGSRFGKRMKGNKIGDAEAPVVVGKDLRCVYTGTSDFYRCSDRIDPNDDSGIIDSNFLNESFK